MTDNISDKAIVRSLSTIFICQDLITVWFNILFNVEFRGCTSSLAIILFCPNFLKLSWMSKVLHLSDICSNDQYAHLF